MMSRQHAEPYGQQASEDQVLLWQIVDTAHASLFLSRASRRVVALNLGRPPCSTASFKSHRAPTHIPEMGPASAIATASRRFSIVYEPPTGHLPGPPLQSKFNVYVQEGDAAWTAVTA